MSIKTLLPPSSHRNDRYHFRSQSHDTRLLLKTKSDTTPPAERKRYKFSSPNPEEYPDIYKFPINENEKRSHSSDTNRYYFSLENSIQYFRPGSGLDQRSIPFVDGSSTFISDTPYLFSKTSRSHRYPTTTSTYIQSEDTCTYQEPADYRHSSRMDTVTSTNGSLSILKRSPTVHFKSSLLSPTACSYLNEARKRLSGKRGGYSQESFEKSVDRLVSSVNKKYGQQHIISSSTSSSFDYISQYYAKEDLENIPQEEKFYYNSNTNHTHTQIMKSVNKSLIDRNYQFDKNRLKSFEENVRRYLRLFENQSLQRELNYDLIRCFSSSYLLDLRREEIRQNQTRSHIRAYTYEDIQDIHIPSILEAYKMKIAIDREKYQRLQPSTIIGQVSPGSSSGYSPIMTGSFSESMDTQPDRRSYTSMSTNVRPNVDVFYEVIQESVRSTDASIAGHVSKASQFTKSRSRQSYRTNSDVDIKSSSLFWSDEDIGDQYNDQSNRRKTIPHQRKISRYVSTINRSLLDHPSDLIVDFYLSQLNRNMQESVRHIEMISRNKASEQDYRTTHLSRSLSAEHLYQVRKEHLRYKQPFTKPTSFTAEDVADIYKRFVLENYKRKIAIELERRRRQRQGQFISSPSIHRIETDINKPFHRPRARNDYVIVSPPIIVQTKEIIMGRARRTLTNDGTSDIVHHISSVSPPTVYSINKQPKIKLTTTNHLHITTVDPPNFLNRNERIEIPRTSYRPQARIYTNLPQTQPIQISHANRIDSKSESDSLSMVHEEYFVTLNQHEIHSLTDQSYNKQMTYYTEEKPKHEQSTLIVSVEEHIPTIREDISVREYFQTTNLPKLTINKANEISADSGISLNTSYINQQPTIFNSSYEDTIEPLPGYKKTIIRNQISDIDRSNEPVSLASLTPAINKQHATQMIDENYYWKTCEKLEQSTCIPIIIYDTEWQDEKVQILSDKYSINIQNAEYKYPQNHEYEHIKIEIQEILDTNDQIKNISDDSYLIRHQQQTNIHIDQLPYLENPLHSTDILTLNYPYHHKKQSTISRTSSVIEIDTFLNQFEESLEHEQHLPLIDQISISYATSIIERNQPTNYRSLPIECFNKSPPAILSHDEQLVEQWIVEQNLDTIQQEGTLHRQQVDFLTNIKYENLLLAISPDNFFINSSLKENNNIISHCSPTSDYETDTVEKDNDTVTSTVIIPITILPSSSLTNPTLLSQSSSLLTSYTAPIAPIVYFLDVLALEEKERNHTTKDFLLTIGFGQNKMNEITNTVSTFEQPLRPTWINRSIDDIEILPTTIHHDDETTLSSIQQQIFFATENQLDDDDTALLIYPLYLQQEHDLGEHIHVPLTTVSESIHLHVPMINEVHIYQMNLNTKIPFFRPPDVLPHILIPKIQEDELTLPDEYHIKQPEILSFAQINYILDTEEETQPISIKLDQLTYTEHYHIQSLFPFPETCYAEINQPEIITTTPTNHNNNNNNNNHFLSNFILTKPIKIEDDGLLNRLMGENTENNQTRIKYPEKNLYKSPLSVEVRPPTPTGPGPIYEQVKIRKDVDVDMGTDGQYRQQANYVYGNEKDLAQKHSSIERTRDTKQAQFVSKHSDDIFVPETIIEHISEDEKSTTSEEVVFEEWTEEFRCRRIDEYDRNTNRLVRSTMDETGDRIKSDVLKEEYKEKNTRIKGHKSYDVVKEVYRRVPANPQEEIPEFPPQDRRWTSEEVYTTEIVQDPNLARELESTAQKFQSLTPYDHVRPSQYSPIPSTRYDDKRKQEEEEVVSEEYQVEFETPIKRDGISTEDPADQTLSPRQDSDWRNKYKQLYTSPSDEDQYKNQNNGNYLAQRASVVPSTTQQRFKEVQIKLPGHDKTLSENQRKTAPLPPSRHTVKEVLVCISRGSSPDKQYHPSLTDENEQKKKRMFFTDSETPKRVSPTDDYRSQSPKRSPTSSSLINERRTQYESVDRPIYSRVGELKNTFQTTTNGNTSDEISKYKTPITPGLTEQRRRMFEEQERTQRPINDFHTNERRMSETHTAPSLVSDRISRFESSLTKSTTPQTSIDMKYKNKQLISSIDSDLSGPTQPIYQSTPKSSKQKHHDDAGHESEDELSDPKQSYGTRQRTSKTRVRDFSQSTSQPIDATSSVQRTISKFNEANMENILSHVPTSKGKGILIELSPHTSQSPTKSNLMSDSGVFDYSTTTTHQIPTGSPSWRHDDTIRSRDHGVYMDSTTTTTPYTRRQISDADQTPIQNVDDSASRSTYRYDRDLYPKQQQQQQRTVRRQLTNSPPINYENLTSYQSRIDPQGKVTVTTQSRSIKPYVVDEIETIETETNVECNIQRTNELKESTKTERLTSPISPSKKILTTITRSSDETTPAKRVLLNDRPQYYESPKDETRFQPIERDHSQDNLPYSPSSRTYSSGLHTMEVTSLSPRTQVTINKHSPNEIIATIRVPELSNSTIHHGTSESNFYEKTKQEERPKLHYQRVQATSYRPPLIASNYQQPPIRSRFGSDETTNDYSSPINAPVRSASYHSILHDQQQQQQQQYQPYRPQTRYHSGSLGNLFGSNLDFEIEIEKRPPHQPEQPTRITLDQPSRAIVTTSKDGRVSIQNIAAYPGNTVVINSDYHSSDRSLNRSSGYFSSDEPRSQGHTTNYSSDEQSTGANQYSFSPSSPTRNYQTNDQISTPYHFNQVNEVVQHYSQPSTNFNEAVNQIDAVYNNLDVQTNEQQPYDFSKLNRRKQLTQNPTEYSQRYTSTGFQNIPSEQQQPTSGNWASSGSLNNLASAIPIRPSQSRSSSGVLTDYGTPGSSSQKSGYGSIQNLVVHQNRLNGQSEIVQRNRTSVKQVKQKNAAKKRNGNIPGTYSDEDEENDSPLSDSGRTQPSPRAYNFNNHHQ